MLFNAFVWVSLPLPESCSLHPKLCPDLQLATEESKNFKDRNIFIVLVPNKAVVQKAQQDPGKKKDKPTKNEVSAGV